jgi:hypothetical protein
VSAVGERHPSDQTSHPEGGGEARINAGWNWEAGRIRDWHQLS